MLIMVNVSKKYLERNLKNKIWAGFLKEIAEVKSESGIEQLFEKLFTSSERIMIEKRLAIFYLISQGFKYREIGQMIDVVPSTISFVKKGFKKPPKKEKKLSRLQEIDLKRAGKRKYPAYPTYKGKGRWRFLDM